MNGPGGGGPMVARMEAPKRGRRWAEAIVMLCGGVPVVVTWLRSYSDTPRPHPQPSYGLTLAVAGLGVLATPLVAWLLRRRMAGSWVAIAAVALTGPLLVVASGVMRARSEAFPEETAPVAGSVIAAAGYLVALAAIAVLRIPRLAARVTPLVVALAVGHIAYGLSWQARYELVDAVGHPYPTEDAAIVIYGHQPYFD